jgi:hypothetical protein
MSIVRLFASAPAIRGAAFAVAFKPAMCEFVLQHGPTHRLRRSTERETAPASAHAFAVMPALLQSGEFVYGCAGSAVPTAGVSHCDSVPAIPRRWLQAGLSPVPLLVKYCFVVVFLFEKT